MNWNEIYHLDARLVATAIPIFFLMIAGEFVWARAQGKEVYRFADAIGDLSCGVTEVLFDVLVKGALLVGYAWVWHNYALIDWGRFGTVGTVALWATAIVGLDFFYYWWHRLSHEVNFMWAVHVVHHQSEDYNLAVALRQAMLSILTSRLFYLPLALLGVPPLAMLISLEISLLYQFWIHTEVIGKFPRWFEYAFNTPSHHRVHHAVNPQYIDRNHAAIFMAWDRLFGTFEPEVEPPVYGITTPLRSYNPLWANVHYWLELFEQAATLDGLDRLRVFWKPPGWQPESRGGPQLAKPVSRAGFIKYDPAVPGGLKLYIAVQFASVAGVVVWVGETKRTLSWWMLLAIFVYAVLTMVSWSGLTQRRDWALPLEMGRLGVLAATVPFVMIVVQQGELSTREYAGIGALLAFCVASAALTVRFRRVAADERPPSQPFVRDAAD